MLQLPLSKLKFLFIPISIGIIFSIPLWIAGVPNGPDMSQHIRTAAGYAESWNSYDFYPSWISLTNDGYGDPSSRFYPPVLYLLLSVFQYLLNDWIISFLLTFSLINIIGSVGFFLWVRYLTASSPAAAIATVTFLLTPFHANELFLASLFASYTASCFIPYVFYFTGRLFEERTWQNVAGIGLTLALVIYSHVPMAIFCVICLVIYSIIRWIRNRDLLTLLMLCVSALLAALLSAVYWVTMLSELKWKNATRIEKSYWYDYGNNFLFQLTADENGDWWLKILSTLVGILVLPTLILIHKKDKSAYPYFGLVFFTFLMATSASRPIWDRLAFLQQTQFPWRWLSVTSMFLAVLIAFTYKHFLELWKSKYRFVAFILSGCFLIPLSFTIFQIIRSDNYLNRTKFTKKYNSSMAGPTNSHFLPIWTTGQLRPMSNPVESNRTVRIVEWNNTKRIIEIEAGSPERTRVKLLYYPHWKARTETLETLATSPDSDGALLILPPAEASRITIDFDEPDTVRISRFMSLAGIFLFLVLLFLKNPGGKRESEGTPG